MIEKGDKIIPIIILNWNGVEDTIECLESLFKSSIQNFKIFLLDNGSETKDVEKLKNFVRDDSRIELILSESNLGFAKGNNFVFDFVLESKIPFDYLILLNNDTSVDAYWLEALVKLSKEKDADVVSSKMINYFERKVMDNAGHKMINTAEVVPIAYRHNTDEVNSVIETFGACAGACLYKKDMLDKIGLFDNYFSTGYEDAEIGVRAVVAGYKAYFAPDAMVYHKISQSVNKIMSYEYLVHIQANIYYTYLKLMPWPVILISIPSFFFKYLMVVIVDIVFWRPKYLKIQFDAFRKIFLTERSLVMKKRKAFFGENKTISSIAILRKQEFFLWFDIKRFFKYIVFKKKSEFDKV